MPVQPGTARRKTRLIEFGRFASERRKRRGEGKPETFDFLGFTHICGKNRNGEFQIVRQTIRKRSRMELKSIRKELRLRLHDSIVETGRWLCRVMKGYYRYYGVPLNSHALGLFYYAVCKAWFQILKRRS